MSFAIWSAAAMQATARMSDSAMQLQNTNEQLMGLMSNAGGAAGAAGGGQPRFGRGAGGNNALAGNAGGNNALNAAGGGMNAAGNPMNAGGGGVAMNQDQQMRFGAALEMQAKQAQVMYQVNQTIRENAEKQLAQSIKSTFGGLGGTA